MDLRPVEDDRDPGDAAAGGEDRGEHGVLVGEPGLVLRIADGEGEGGEPLEVDGADLLVVEAVGLGGGDDDRVRPLPEGEEEVQGEGADGGRLLDAGHFAAIEGDEDAVDAVAAGDEPGQGDGVLLDAGLITRGAEGELEGARRGGLRNRGGGASPPAGSWPLRLATRAPRSAAQRVPAAACFGTGS